MEKYVKTLSESHLWGVDLLMILVTLGTQDKGFPRLLRLLEKKIKEGIIKDKVVVQAGYTKYQSEVMEIFDSIPKDELEKLTKKADLIITHGGVGSILTALKYQKPIIAAARLARYKEHTNDHQKQIIEEFSQAGYLIPLKDFSKFDKVYEKAKKFKPKKYVSHQQAFIKEIEDYIEKEDHISWYHRDGKVIFVAILNFLLFLLLSFSKLNALVNLSICYLFSFLLLTLLKNRKLARPITSFIFSYMLDFLLLLLFYYNLSLPLLLSKALVNLILIIVYHYLDKRSYPRKEK